MPGVHRKRYTGTLPCRTEFTCCSRNIASVDLPLAGVPRTCIIRTAWSCSQRAATVSRRGQSKGSSAGAVWIWLGSRGFLDEIILKHKNLCQKWWNKSSYDGSKSQNDLQWTKLDGLTLWWSSRAWPQVLQVALTLDASTSASKIPCRHGQVVCNRPKKTTNLQGPEAILRVESSGPADIILPEGNWVFRRRNLLIGMMYSLIN